MTIILCILGFIAIFWLGGLIAISYETIKGIFDGIVLNRQIAEYRKEAAEYRKHTAEVERATERIYHCIALDYDMQFRKKHQAVTNNYYIDKAVILKGENDDAKTIVQPVGYSYECQ